MEELGEAECEARGKPIKFRGIFWSLNDSTRCNESF